MPDDDWALAQSTVDFRNEYLRGDHLPPGHGGPERVDLPANDYCPGCGVPRRTTPTCPRCGAAYDPVDDDPDDEMVV